MRNGDGSGWKWGRFGIPNFFGIPNRPHFHTSQKILITPTIISKKPAIKLQILSGIFEEFFIFLPKKFPKDKKTN